MATPRFAKVDANLDSNPKVRRAGRNGREVFLFVLRHNANLDRSGRLPVSYVEPWYLADQLMMSEDEARDGVSRAVTAGLLIVGNGEVSISGWDDEWAKAPLTTAERKAKERERAKATGGKNKRSKRESRNVTTENVTQSDSHACHTSDQSREEEKRVEESRGEGEAASQRAHRLKPGWVPSRSEANEAAEAEARSRGVDLRVQLKKLHDWALDRGKPGKDWDARWRNWIREARPTQRNGNNGAQTALDAQLERVRMLEAEERAARGEP